MDFSLLNKILFILTISLGIWVGFWVYFADRRAKMNRVFVVGVIILLIWIVLCYISTQPFPYELRLFLWRLTHGVVTLFFISAYYFAIYFPREGKRHFLKERIYTIVFLVFSLFSVSSDLIIRDIEITKKGVELFIGNFGKYIYFPSLALAIPYIISLIWQKYHKLPQDEKLKVQYLLIGVIVFAGTNLIFNILLPLWKGITSYLLIGTYSTIFFFIFTAYAIVKRELFGIKVILTTLLVGFIAILLWIDAILFTENPFYQILKTGILAFFLYFGYLLVKTTHQEIERRKEIERLAFQLEKSNLALKELTGTLEEKVKERTKELQEKIDELNKWYKLTVGRELKMAELKEKIKELEEKLKKQR